MIRITFASLVGGLALFLWGSFVHVLSGWYDAAFDRFPDEQSVFDVIEQHAPTGGLSSPFDRLLFMIELVRSGLASAVWLNLFVANTLTDLLRRPRLDIHPRKDTFNRCAPESSI